MKPPFAAPNLELNSGSHAGHDAAVHFLDQTRQPMAVAPASPTEPEGTLPLLCALGRGEVASLHHGAARCVE